MQASNFKGDAGVFLISPLRDLSAARFRVCIPGMTRTFDFVFLSSALYYVPVRRLT
jgi:hypothetical protein